MDSSTNQAKIRFYLYDRSRTTQDYACSDFVEMVVEDSEFGLIPNVGVNNAEREVYFCLQREGYSAEKIGYGGRDYTKLKHNGCVSNDSRIMYLNEHYNFDNKLLISHGVPDLLVGSPIVKKIPFIEHDVFFVEVKTKPQSLTEHQREWINSTKVPVYIALVSNSHQDHSACLTPVENEIMKGVLSLPYEGRYNKRIAEKLDRHSSQTHVYLSRLVYCGKLKVVNSKVSDKVLYQPTEEVKS